MCARKPAECSGLPEIKERRRWKNMGFGEWCGGPAWGITRDFAHFIGLNEVAWLWVWGMAVEERVGFKY